MVHRTRRQRGGFLGNLAQRAASAYVNNVALPVTKYAVKQAVKRSGLENTPELQAAQSMFRDAKAAYLSPQGQAMKAQLFQAATSPQAQALMAQARQAATSPQAQAAAAGLLGMAAPQLANVYGRSAAAPVPVAQPVAVPVAQPVAAAPAAPAPSTLSLAEQAITNRFLMFHQRGKPNETDASYIAEIAKQLKNKPRNNALLAGIGALATDVKALHDAGTPQTVPFETAMSRTRGFPSLNAFELYETLSDPATRSRIARELVSAQDPPTQPNSRRFLAGVINQFAVAIRNAMQKKLLLGGKTRRGRKARRTTRRR